MYTCIRCALVNQHTYEHMLSLEQELATTHTIHIHTHKNSKRVCECIGSQQHWGCMCVHTGRWCCLNVLLACTHTTSRGKAITSICPSVCLTLCHTKFLPIGTFTLSDYWGCIVWLWPYWYTLCKYSMHSSISLVPRPHTAWEQGYSCMCSDSEYGSSYCSACDIAWGTYVFLSWEANWVDKLTGFQQQK